MPSRTWTACSTPAVLSCSPGWYISTISALATSALAFKFCICVASIPYTFLTRAALSVMDRNDTSTFWASIFLFLLFHEPFQTVLAYKLAILHKARLIPFVVAFLKVFYQLAWIVGTLKTIGQPSILDTILYLAFAAMLRLYHIAV